MAADASLPVFFVSIDLEVDALWDLADPVTFHRMAEAVEEGLIDIVLGGPPCAYSGPAPGSSTWRICVGAS